MRLPITKFMSLTIHEKHITFKVKCGESNIDSKAVEASEVMLLNVDGLNLICSPESVTTKDGRLSVLLRFNRSFYVVKKLWALAGVEAPERSYIYLSEKVDETLFNECHLLLKRAAEVEGISEPHLLEKLTAFKDNVGGKSDLRFVSAKQMTVLVDKLKKNSPTTKNV